ncbi:hypothetical protein F4821DRAFT_246733 [Hypoxylon rubiginosum]|uniref:Uncharacterized protein n=1 Tax=Hypoxylon rubiginosum TaxID=110542 RepID=A0ACC0CQH7_9PEZI|nr:hypothetical protein F4821DRAFT_246733 [Hypoxylon rubiginosum]
MGEEQDLPIALRRTPRASVGGGGAASHTLQFQTGDSTSQCSRTPSKPRSKKRVRFSDPGPEIQHHDADAPSTTGLTPMVRRTSLGAGPSPKRRRHSTPIRRRLYTEGDEDELCGDGNNNGNNEVHFLSLRQVLDDRLKRRIRRNGLSEEMNVIDQEKRQRTQGHKTELQRLRDELEEKDQEIDRLQNTTMVQDTDRILELEQEIEELRDELRRRSPDIEADQTQPFDWTMAARDPFSDSYMDDDEGFGETTMADLVCSTPSKNRASASFPTPPCTSPTIPATPCSMRRGPPVTPQSSHVGVQASFPDPEKEALEAELGSLRLELTKLTEVLEDHETLKTRIADKLTSAGSVPESAVDSKDEVEAHLDSVLQALSDCTAALLDLNSSLSALGFAGRDAGEVVASLSSAFRSARLELEYLTPGELTLPLSSRGAEVLDLVLVRLRDLARRVKEDDDAIDEYHALELSLRQQLNARVDATDGLQAQLRERDARIGDLEVGVERLKGAAEGYRRDVAELETLVQRLEQEGKETEARLQSEVGCAQAELSESKANAADLEARLARVREQADVCKKQLEQLQKRRAAEVRALNKYHGTALAVRDARVVELRRGIEDVNRSLHEAHTTIQQLRVENLGLSRRVDDEKRRAKEAVDAMKAELERVLRMSAEFLATPRKTRSSTRRASNAGEQGEQEKETSTTPEGSPMRPGAYLAAELAKTGKGAAKKRKYDSGLGFLDEDEDGDESVEMV